MRIRRTRRALTFLAVAGVTVLATAACGTNGSSAADSPNGGKGAGSSVSGSPASGSSAEKTADVSAAKEGKTGSSAQGQDASGTSGSSGASGGNSGGSGSASGTSGAAAAKGGACTTGSVKISLADTGGTLPAVLLKATNASGSSCDLYGFPTVGYPGAQSAIGANEHSKPQAVVTLAPGKSGYAAISLPSGADKHREKVLTIGLRGRDMGPIDGQDTVTAFGSGIALTDSSMVTYWQSDEAAALQ
ncbi:DUF4232 domain-containing protein [Streptomyces sp. NBC_00440]|uniref:DUF4232 domain-containing protein n=1 Tax=unclassified Streptomyces TaxID=2593676 RepID=UPI002E23D66C|nr:DUF4232 domain-containing protein [Streptomyces sp. NBC_00932]